MREKGNVFGKGRLQEGNIEKEAKRAREVEGYLEGGSEKTNTPSRER